MASSPEPARDVPTATVPATVPATVLATVLATVPATVLATVLFFLGTGLAPIPALTWLAPLPVLALAPRVRARTAFGAAFLAHLVGSANQLPFFLQTPSVPLPVGLAILAAVAALFALVTLLFRALVRRGLALTATLATPAAWVTGVHLNTLFNPVGIIYPLATTQADLPAVIQIVAVTGSTGLEYLVLLVPAALAALTAPATTGAARARVAATVAALCALSLGYGALRPPAIGPTHQVAVLSATRFAWAPDAATPGSRALLASYAKRIAALPASVRTVVLPEAVLTTTPGTLPAVTRTLRALTHERDLDVVIGVIHTTPTTKRNQTIAFPAGGAAPVVYDKWHFAPGAPFQRGHHLAHLRHGRIGLANCMDLNFPDPTRDYGRTSARLLAVPAADEFGNGWQHSRAGLLRGVEHGLAIAWSAQQGTPMISDAWGRVLAESTTEAGAPGPFALAVADVPLSSGPTLYARLGDWFPWLCLAATLAATLVAATRARRMTSGSPGGGTSGEPVTVSR